MYPYNVTYPCVPTVRHGLGLCDAAKDEKVTIGLFLAALIKQAYDYYNTRSMVLPTWPERTRKAGRLCGKTIGKEESFGFFLESPSSVYLVIRGTQNLDDWIANLTAVPIPFNYVSGGGSVDAGFLTLYSSFRDYLITMLLQFDPHKTLYITGHSLGGALATLAALDIAVNSAFKQPVCVTFASPRVGLQNFVDKFDRTINESIRVVNTVDIVPKVPPDPPYKHVKGKIAFTVDNGKGNIVGNHSMDTAYFPGLVNMCRSCADEVCGNNPPGFCPKY